MSTTAAPYEHEAMDKTAEFTVATTYCSGRVTLDYPVNRIVALKHYLKKVSQGAKLLEQGLTTENPTHIKRVDLLRRGKKEPHEVEFHMGTESDLPVCDCGVPAGDVDER